MKLFSYCLTFILSMLSILNTLQAQNEVKSQSQITRILEDYALDYQNDINLKKDITFGIKVDDQFWHIIAQAKSSEKAAKVQLNLGPPAEPSFYFVTDFLTLKKIEAQKMNALTGAAKAFSSDEAPFDIDVMEGFQPGSEFLGTMLNVLFHFWTRGTPEIIPYGLDLTRFTHGAQASIFYYQPGFRSGYIAIQKGQHANKDEKSKTNPFPTLLIAIKGEGVAIINGKKSILKEGEAMLIPAGVEHEFLNPDHEDPLECIILMFGEGA